MKPLILHIGLHKTATTSLQRFLHDQSPALEAHGVRHLPLGQMRKRFTNGIRKGDPDALRALRTFLAETPDDAMLLSDENLIGVPGDATRRAGLYAGARRRVQAIVDAALPRRTLIFLTLREPGPFLVSLYCEYLRHRPFVAFDRYAERLDLAQFSFASTFAWLRKADFRDAARILPFEERHGGGLRAVADAMLRAACGDGHGVDLDALPAARSRSSFTAEEIALFAEVALRAGPKVARETLAAVERLDARFGATRFDPLAPGLRETLRARYEADLAKLGATVHPEAAIR